MVAASGQSGGLAAGGVGDVLYTIPEVDEDEDGMCDWEDGPAATDLDDSTPPTAPATSTDGDHAAYRIVNSHLVPDDDSKFHVSGPTTSSEEVYSSIEFLAATCLLNLNTYSIVFETAARACSLGRPFWLNESAVGGVAVVRAR